MNTWYLLETTAGTPAATGPFSLTQLAAMVSSGRLTRTTKVARAGTQSWIAAGDDPELIPLFSPSGWQGASATAPTTEASAEPSILPPYSLAAAFTIGWEAFKKSWGLLVLVALINLGIGIAMMIPQWIGQFIIVSTQGGSRGNQDELSIGMLGVTCCGVLLQLFVGVPIQAGMNYAGVRAVRGELQVSDIFAGFRRYGAVLGTGILMGLTTFAIFAVCLVPFIIGMIFFGTSREPWPAIVGGVISFPLVIAAALFFSVFLHLPLTLVVDPRMKARWGPGAMSIAWQLGKGNSPSYFVLALCAGLICAVSFCGCGVGILLFGIPFFLATTGAAYELLTAPLIAKGPDPRRAD